MAATRHKDTPDVVVRFGWRDADDPYKGKDVCTRCMGYGALEVKAPHIGVDVPKGSVATLYRTCPGCNGTGHG